MNLRRVVLVFALLPLLVALERFAYYCARAITPMHASQVLALSPADISRLYAVQTVVMVVALLVGGGAAAVTGPAALVVTGFLVCTIGQALLMFADGVALLWTAVLVGAVGQGLFRPGLWALAAAELSHPREQLRNAAFIVLYAAVNIGAFFAPMVVSGLATRLGTAWALGVALAVMTVATLFAFGFAILWWVFRAEQAADAAAHAPALPRTGRVLGAAAGLIMLAVVFHAMLAAGSSVQWSGASGGRHAPSTILVQSVNPISVLMIAVLVAGVSVGLHFGRVRLSALFVVGAGLCLASSAALPLLLAPASVGALTVASIVTGVAEVLFVPFALSRASGDVPQRFAPAVLAVWFAATFGASALVSRLGGWLPGSPTPLLAGFAGLGLLLGGALLLLGKSAARACYEPAEAS